MKQKLIDTVFWSAAEDSLSTIKQTFIPTKLQFTLDLRIV